MANLAMMDVKTAQLKNKLSYYLRRVRERGETVVVYDRDEPIAMLGPLTGSTDWKQRRLAVLAAVRKSDLELDIPAHAPTGILAGVAASVAPDGRTDLSTINLVRGGRDY
jgi:antitoxin (DNA-binding transcriptional repressor) of toxin-antitoxin stability system